MRESGIHALLWDWLTPLGAPERATINSLIASFQTVLIAVSHAPQAGVSPENTHVFGLRNLWESGLSVRHAKWIYLSTTGVYGSPSDSLSVDENSPVSPTRPGSIAALAGEEWCRAAIALSNLVILRPAGIYGPNRVPNWQAVRDSIPLQMDAESYLNLIHRDDLVSTIQHFADHPARYPLYSVSDGAPPTRQQYYDFIAQLGRWPSPVFASNDPASILTTPHNHTTARKSRSAANKRVNAQRLHNEFSSFAFQNYEAGLRAILKDVIASDNPS
jgi:nucleoside-diphosphate-sugar epimerase